MLIEIAVGDAYGAAFEYVKPEHIRAFNTLAAYARHPRHGLEPGSYTDDTQMSVAVAEVLLDEPSWSRAAFADRFVHAFKRDPRDGYARGFQKFLEGIADGASFLREIRPDSDKSGAAMRACPIGLLDSVGRVVEVATLQAKVTHDTPDGINAAVAAALAAHFFAYRLGSPEELGAFLVENVEGAWDAAWVGEVGPKGWMSVRAAITAIRRNRSLASLLRDCVEFGGDVDTVAAIALGAASMSEDYARDLPEALVDGLENGPFGRDFLRSLDRRLLQKLGFEPRT
ncbi:MAG: ADP-ribosylglycohydrolase family protein [Minicystis sp.]